MSISANSIELDLNPLTVLGEENDVLLQVLLLGEDTKRAFGAVHYVHGTRNVVGVIGGGSTESQDVGDEHW